MMLNPSKLLLLVTVLVGCSARVKSDDLDDEGNGGGGDDTSDCEQNPEDCDDGGDDALGMGQLRVTTESLQSAENTDHVTMDIERVEVHIVDEAVADEIGGEWLVLSEEAQTVVLVEQEPQSYELCLGTAPEAQYDAIRIKITGGEYLTTDGDVYELNLPDEIGLFGSLTIDTDFCVADDTTTELVTQFNAEVTGIDEGTGLDLDVAVDDGDSCSISRDED